jgi:hypothetical protein
VKQTAKAIAMQVFFVYFLPLALFANSLLSDCQLIGSCNNGG